MRIAILGIKTMPAFAGADRVAERLVEAMPGHDYIVYVVRDPAVPRPAAPNRRYVEIPAPRGKHVFAFFYFFLCAVHYVVRGGADVVHVHNSEFGLFCPIVKLRRSTRIVGTFHGCHHGPREREKWGRGARAFLRLSELFFVRSCDALTTVAPLPVEFRGAEISYIPNGVDPWSPKSPPADLPSGLSRLEHARYVLFAAGRLDSTKGLHHLLDAYRGLPARLPLVAVADFSHDQRYTGRIEEAARRDARVILHRSLLGREALFSLIAGATLFVFPSEFEAMSMMLLEVIACQKLVVCSDIAENVAIVGPDYPFLFRSGDRYHLRQVLRVALDEPADSEAVAHLFERVRSRFRWDHIASQYETLYMSPHNRVDVSSPRPQSA